MSLYQITSISMLVGLCLCMAAVVVAPLPGQAFDNPPAPSERSMGYHLVDAIVASEALDATSDRGPDWRLSRLAGRPAGTDAGPTALADPVRDYRSEEYGALLAAELSAAAARAPYRAPSPQGSDAPPKRMRGWVKATIVVGSTIAGVAIFRAVIGPDEDLAPLQGN